MKKIITTILAATLILSTTACGQNTEIEALKEENEQLRAQLEVGSEMCIRDRKTNNLGLN